MNKLKSDLIRKLLHAGATDRAARALERLKPADVADLFGALSPGEIVTMVNVLFRSNRAAKTLAALPSDYLPTVLQELPDEQIATIMSRLPADDGATMSKALPEERRQEIMRHIPGPKRVPIERILYYPKDSAGRLMSTDFMAFDPHITAQSAIEEIRNTAHALDTLFHLYVVDENNHLMGSIPLRKIIAARPEQTLGEIMVREPLTIPALADQEEAARLVARHDLLAIPVVTDQHDLVGIITVDDVIDVIQEEATEDMYLMAGLTEEDRVFSPPTESIRRRLPWNFLNMMTAFLAAAVVGLFENTIEQMVALAVFMPVVAGMGGNTGLQTLTVVTRGIALGEIQFSSGMRAVVKEVLVGLCIGIMMGLITACIAYAWKGEPMLGVVLVLAMVCNMTLAGLMGAAIPLCLQWMNQDPAMGGSILLTAFTDSVGFLTFLGLATWMMPYLI